MRTPNRTLVVLLWLVAGGVLAQAVLAGLFVSGIANLRFAHVIVGWILPYVGIFPAIAAWVQRSREQVSLPVTTGAVALPFLLFLQEALGHMPWPATTAVHVPFGVVLFGGSLALAIAATRPTGRAAGPSATPTHATADGDLDAA